MTPQQYCQQKAAQSGSSFYYSFLFLPQDQRQAIMALYAFCREIDDIVDECSETAISQVKLSWWRSEIDRLFAKQAQHPVTQALTLALAKFKLQKKYFLLIIDGVEMDLEKNRYADFGELKEYCYRVASVVGLMAAEIFGYRDQASLEYASRLGLAFQMTNIIRDVREDIERDRIYLPMDEMAKFNVREADIINKQSTDDFCRLMKFQADRANRFYQEAFALLPDMDRYSQRSGIIMAEIYRKTLQEIENDGFRVLEHRIRLTPLRKFWIAWKIARREKKIFKNENLAVQSLD